MKPQRILILAFLLLLAGCAAEPPARLQLTPQLLSEVAAAPRPPVELSDAQRQQVLSSLSRQKRGGAQRFADPDLDRQVYASFWRSPLDNQVDRSRLLLVRYSEDGTFVYVGFEKDGRLFTDGVGSLFADPPWAQ